MKSIYKSGKPEPLKVAILDVTKEIIDYTKLHLLRRKSGIKINFSENQRREEKVFQGSRSAEPHVRSRGSDYNRKPAKVPVERIQLRRKTRDLRVDPSTQTDPQREKENLEAPKEHPNSDEVQRISANRGMALAHQFIEANSQKGLFVSLRPVLGGGLALITTHSLLLAFLIGTSFFAIPFFRQRQRMANRRRELMHSWPEILDLMISGLHSGLSIAETLESLETRGPEVTRQLFAECREVLRIDGDMRAALMLIKNHFNEAMADQICEVLDFARSTGSRDTTLTLRTLGNYIRAEIAMREEIRVKHGWIRNSAAVASIAPWLLLGVLSFQPNTRAAYSTPAGGIVLIIGIAMSLVAFFWMHRAGRMPESPRVFQ